MFFWGARGVLREKYHKHDSSVLSEENARFYQPLNNIAYLKFIFYRISKKINIFLQSSSIPSYIGGAWDFKGNF